jgi:hypothetical protein
VDNGLNYAPPTSTKALLPLHYITFVHNILCFSIAFNIIVIGFATGQLRPCLARPWPFVPRRGRATAGYATAPPAATSHSTALVGSSLPCHVAASAGCALAGRALAAARLWLALSWPQPAAPRSWLTAPWLYQGRGCSRLHNPLMKFIKILNNSYFGHLFIQQNGNTIVHKIYICHLYL